MDGEWWAVIREGLQKPWAKEAAWYDLRWMSGTKDGISSRRVLAARWGWTDGQVRTQLRNVDEWWDDHKGEAPRFAAPRPPDPETTKPDPAGPSRTQPQTVDATKHVAPDPAGPSNDQPGPSDIHRRGDPRSQEQEQEQHAAPSAPQSAAPTLPGMETTPPVEPATPPPKPRRTRKTSVKPPPDPRIRLVGNAWAATFVEVTGERKYPWNFYVERNLLARIVDNFELDPDTRALALADVEQLQEAARQYIAAEDAGEIWFNPDEPRPRPCVARFVHGFSRWMQEAAETIAARSQPRVPTVWDNLPEEEPLYLLLERKRAARVAAGLPPPAGVGLPGTLGWALQQMQQGARHA